MIVDASAVMHVLSGREIEAAFRASNLVAPDLIVPETLNAVWKAARVGVPVPESGAVFDLLDKIQIVPSRPYAARAADLADELDHPVYDCLYLALAEAHSDTLLTADVRLSRKLAKSPLRKRVRLIGTP